ncbi:MAG: PIN domain-containing protein [Thermomicrobiales bacterium]|nr:PIN domain-containing protein [Thermomicrobiales bacterium]MCO5220680.1 PIN domain-containing protein [Thermomicrobiales bacterium]
MVTPIRARQRAAFVDSSALISLVDRDDITHRAAVDAYESLKLDGYRLFTSNHMVTEAYDILAGSHGHEIARTWLDHMELPVYVADSGDLEQARDRVLSSRNALNLNDALSVVIMQRLGVEDAFAVDPDFLAALD